MQRRCGFVLKTCLVGNFLCSNSIFTLWFKHGVVFCQYSPHRVVYVRITEHIEEATGAIPPPRSLCIPGSLGTKKVLLTYLFVRMDLPLSSVGPTGPARFCLFFQTLLPTTLWSFDSSTILLTRLSNTVRNKSAETMQKTMSVRWHNESKHIYICTCANICVVRMSSLRAGRCYNTVAPGALHYN